jgi:hypothetical protein
MDLGDSKYQNFYRQKSHKIWKLTPMSNGSIKTELECDLQETIAEPSFLQRTIGLPDGRLFVIGGAKDV